MLQPKFNQKVLQIFSLFYEELFVFSYLQIDGQMNEKMNKEKIFFKQTINFK